jgi:nucleoside-diphosphate-sugar epimerase
MKVLVTGGTGFTGSHTVQAFVDAGHSVRLLVRDREKVRSVFDPRGLAIPESDVIVGDITDESRVAEAMTGCDAVFHAAALVDLRRSHAQTVLRTNARGVEWVIGGAAQRGLPSIVYVSSLAIFFVPGCEPLHTEMPIAPPTTAYARSKADAEREVRRMQAEGASIRVSYPTGIIGPDDPGMTDANNAVYTIFKDTGITTSSGFQTVDVRDLAAVHLAMLEMAPGPQRYVAAGEFLSWTDTYLLLDRLTGAPVRRPKIPGPVLRALGSVGDVVKRVYDFSFPLTRDSMEFATQWPGASGAATSEALGVPFRPAEETYRDTLRWMFEAGHLSAAHVGRLAEG